MGEATSGVAVFTNPFVEPLQVRSDHASSLLSTVATHFIIWPLSFVPVEGRVILVNNDRNVAIWQCKDGVSRLVTYKVTWKLRVVCSY